MKPTRRKRLFHFAKTEATERDVWIMIEAARDDEPEFECSLRLGYYDGIPLQITRHLLWDEIVDGIVMAKHHCALSPIERPLCAASKTFLKTHARSGLYVNPRLHSMTESEYGSLCKRMRKLIRRRISSTSITWKWKRENAKQRVSERRDALLSRFERDCLPDEAERVALQIKKQAWKLLPPMKKLRRLRQRDEIMGEDA
jgi:hypothetical protein